MSKNKSAPKKRFSRGDGVLHAVFGLGHVSATGMYAKNEAGADQWLCRVSFVSDADTYVEIGMRDIPESDLTSAPGTGERKYGQEGDAGRRFGHSSRYGQRRAQREMLSNGRTASHTLVRHHLGDNAR